MLTDPEPTFTLQGTPYLEYLPVVDLSTGRLLGMEALVRWQPPHPGPDLARPADPVGRGQRRHRPADPVDRAGGLRGGVRLVPQHPARASTARSCSCSGVRCPRPWPRPSTRRASPATSSTSRSPRTRWSTRRRRPTSRRCQRHGGAAGGGRRRHQLVVLRAVQAPRHQHGQDRRLVRRRPRVRPGHQPAGGRDGGPHGPLPRDVGRRRGGGVGGPGRIVRRSTPTPPRATSSPARCRDDARTFAAVPRSPLLPHRARTLLRPTDPAPRWSRCRPTRAEPRRRRGRRTDGPMGRRRSGPTGAQQPATAGPGPAELGTRAGE